MASFDKILTIVPERRRPGIKAIRSRIAEVIHDPAKSIDLRKQLAFDPDSGFSIEDPLFRYFLTHMEEARLFSDLGVEQASMELARIYSYDVGFSFAGEVRPLVEAINAELKAEDVVTFYDFDQQAVLLALHLQPAFERIYSESCRYYLVFLDGNYKDKVWTRWEQDILTHSGRREHIIPVIVDEVGEAGLVGIPSTVGHINLKDVYATMRRDAGDAGDVRTSIRNRCVLPMLQKLDDWDGALGTSSFTADDGPAVDDGERDAERVARINALREERRRTGSTLFPELDDTRPKRPPSPGS